MRKKMLAVTFMILALSLAFAPTALAAEELDAEVKKFVALACGFAIGIAALGGAIAQGIAISKGLEGIARNPEAQPKIFVAMIVGLALIESLVIYALVISFLLYGKL